MSTIYRHYATIKGKKWTFLLKASVKCNIQDYRKGDHFYLPIGDTEEELEYLDTQYRCDANDIYEIPIHHITCFGAEPWNSNESR